jgi:hypothetical protein
MNVLESRLRDELHALAELTQPDDIRPLREPARAARFRMAAPRLATPIVRWLAPALAVAAVLGVVIAISVASGLARQRPAMPASGTAAMPRFYITTQSYTHRWEIYVTATVHDSLTGAALITVPVWHRHGWQAKGSPKGTIQYPFADTQISVASNDRMFLINVYDLIYLLRVGGSGRSATIRQVHSTYGSVDTALSPDGKRIAVGLQFCFVPSAGCPPSVGLQILSATDDTVRSWFIPGGKDGTVDPVWLDSSHVEFFIDRSWRILDVNTPGDSLLGDSRPTTTPAPTPLIATARQQQVKIHGATFLVQRVVRLSARTGKVVKVLYTYTQRLSKRPNPLTEGYCEVLSVSSSGQALIDCDTFGRLDGHRFSPLPGFPAVRASLNFMAPNAAW